MGNLKTDLELVSQARHGDTTAFGELIERHQGVVFAVALSHLRQREAAEDLAQDVFLRAWLHLEVLRDGARFGAWVARLARNLALDWVRAGQTWPIRRQIHSGRE
jgi:RNA polymerase sigma-70 factor, ECF subfamily